MGARRGTLLLIVVRRLRLVGGVYPANPGLANMNRYHRYAQRRFAFICRALDLYEYKTDHMLRTAFNRRAKWLDKKLDWE